MENEFGISTAPTTMRMVQMEGENADGVTVYEENVERTGRRPATSSGPDQVIAAMLGTRQVAAESGYQLLSTGVTVTDPAEAAALRDRQSRRSGALIAPAWEPGRFS
jgi:hypothetical protein